MMHVAYFDSEAVLLGYVETNEPVENGTATSDEWPGATFKRVFAYRPDNEPGQYYWDTVSGSFVNVAMRPKPYAKATSALLNAALAARSRGETLPIDIIQALESIIVPTNTVPGIGSQ